jgi:hypothetical protein
MALAKSKEGVDVNRSGVPCKSAPHIRSILAELQENEAFFSIDEFGPFAIRAQGGRTLVGPGEMPTVPQYQKSKGSLIITAALELSNNQITYFYSPRKDTGEMLRMLARLIQEHSRKSRIFLSFSRTVTPDTPRKSRKSPGQCHL